jgi:hypothetical protein
LPQARVVRDPPALPDRLFLPRAENNHGKKKSAMTTKLEDVLDSGEDLILRIEYLRDHLEGQLRDVRHSATKIEDAVGPLDVDDLASQIADARDTVERGLPNSQMPQARLTVRCTICPATLTTCTGRSPPCAIRRRIFTIP